MTKNKYVMTQYSVVEHFDFSLFRSLGIETTEKLYVHTHTHTHTKKRVCERENVTGTESSGARR